MSDHIRDISEKVYRIALDQSLTGDVDRMITKDGDSGEKLRARAGAYDRLTRIYLAVLRD